MKYCFFITLILITTLAGCSSLLFTSRWASNPVDIYASSEELQNALTRIEEKSAMVGFLNDSNYLYLSLVTSDKDIQRQMLLRGFTIWFDREGGEEKQFGIRFPLGMQPGDFRQMREDWNRNSERGEGHRDRASLDSLMERLPPIDTTEIEILGPGEEKHERLKIIQLKQILVKITVADGRLQYNVKVPLTDNGPDPYAIGTKPGATIGIGLETASFRRRGMSSGAMSGEAGSMRGERGGFGGGRPPSGQFQQSEPLKVWAKVQLADGK